jgi:hypothetical protein
MYTFSLFGWQNSIESRRAGIFVGFGMFWANIANEAIIKKDKKSSRSFIIRF